MWSGTLVLRDKVGLGGVAANSVMTNSKVALRGKIFERYDGIVRHDRSSIILQV
jgi:hypothetical protein